LSSVLFGKRLYVKRIPDNIQTTNYRRHTEHNFNRFHNYSTSGAGVIKIAIVTKTATHSKINIFLLLIDSDYSIPQSGNNVKRFGRKGAVSAQCWAAATAWAQHWAGMCSRAGEQREPHYTPLFHTDITSAFP
jgi:hypothetical protein